MVRRGCRCAFLPLAFFAAAAAAFCASAAAFCARVHALPSSRLASLARSTADFSTWFRELLVAGVELGADELQRLLAELGIGELVEHGVDRGLGAAAEEQLRHHAARGDRAGADLLAQRALGGGALLGEHLGGALGEHLVVAVEERDELGGDATGAHVGEAVERDAPDHRRRRRRAASVSAASTRLVALADRGEHGRRGSAQIDAFRVEQIDDRSA